MLKLMDQEYRIESRINTHIVTEITVDGELHNYCGYIENLSKDGIGIISLEQFEPGSKVTHSFSLTGAAGKITSQATLMHSEKGVYNLYYHGFKFENLTEKQSQAIERYMLANDLTRTA
jgi:hypothetical protein